MKELIKLKENNNNLRSATVLEFTFIRDKFDDTFNLLNNFSDIPIDIKQSLYENLRQAFDVYEELDVITFEINALKMNTEIINTFIKSVNSESNL